MTSIGIAASGLLTGSGRLVVLMCLVLVGFGRPGRREMGAPHPAHKSLGKVSALGRESGAAGGRQFDELISVIDISPGGGRVAQACVLQSGQIVAFADCASDA